MAATDRVDSAATDAATSRIDFDVFDAKCAERGATTDRARARVAGVDRTTIWRWRKRGVTPDLDTLTDIAQRFDISLDELTGRAA